MELKTVIIDSAERIFLDGEELQNVTAYKLKHSADSEGPADGKNAGYNRPSCF